MTVLGLTTSILLFSTAMPGPLLQQESELPVSKHDRNPITEFRAPLLREGSYLVDVPGRMIRDDVHQWWRFEIDAETMEPGSPSHELILLPCTRLAEMERIAEATAESGSALNLTGRVFVFRGHNFVLPTHTAIVAASEPATKPQTDATQPQTESVDGADDSAEAIIRELAEATGPLMQSSARIGSTKSRPSASDSEVREPALRENETIVARRGTITRARGGGWMFVFDSDANGLSDPPLRLLPCQLLQRIESHAKRSGHHAPAILSGPVYLYRGRNFLMPTVFRIPHDRSNVTP